MKSEAVGSLHYGKELSFEFVAAPEGFDFLSVLLDITGQPEGEKKEKSIDNKQNLFLYFPSYFDAYSSFFVIKGVNQEQEINFKDPVIPLQREPQKDINIDNPSLKNMDNNVVENLSLNKNTSLKQFSEDEQNKDGIYFKENNQKIEDILEVHRENQSFESMDNGSFKAKSEEESLKVLVKEKGEDVLQKDKFEGLIYNKPLQKEENQEVKQEITRTESIEKQTFIRNYETKALKVDIEDIKLKFNFLGDRLRLNIVLNEDKYISPTGYEVQKLVTSLQSLGFNVETFKLNGNLLYSSDNKNGGKRDEKYKTAPNYTGKEVENVKGKSFSLYL